MRISMCPPVSYLSSSTPMSKHSRECSEEKTDSKRGAKRFNICFKIHVSLVYSTECVGRNEEKICSDHMDYTGL